MPKPSALLFYRIAATPNVNLGRIRSIVDKAMSQERGTIKSFAVASPNRESWELTLGIRQEVERPGPDGKLITIQDPPPSKDTPEFEARTQKAMYQQFKKDLMGMTCGWGPDKHPCGYREGQGIGQEGDKNVVESSFFIPNISLQSAHQLWKKYYQWGIVYTGPETKGRVILMSQHSDGSFGIDDIGAMWTFTHPANQQMMQDSRSDFPNKSKFKGRELVFASVTPLLRPKR